MVNIIKHNEVRKLMEQSRKLSPDVNIEDLESVIASNDGYILTKDGRILLRMAVGSNPVRYWRSETKDLGLDVPGVTPQEAYAYISRLAAMPAYEQAALLNQRDAARLHKMLTKILTNYRQHLSDKDQIEVVMLLRDTEE